MSLKDLSKPSGGERNGGRKPHQPDVKRKKALRSAESIHKAIKRQADVIEERLDAKGIKPTFDDLTEMRQFLKGAVAHVQPFNADGTPREEPGRSMDVFLKVTELFVRCCSVLLPFERPRLAQIAFHDERHEDEPEQYETVWQMRMQLIKEGLPVDHIDNRPRLRLIEHHDAGADKSTGGNK